MPLVSWKSCLLAGVLFRSHATAFTGSGYQLTHEYSGTNFFDGWDFYSGRDPTGGFVTYYSRSSAQLTGLISSSEEGPAYMGVNYVDTLPFDNQTGQGDGAGRPSVRIATKDAFTHGLFIGDFAHIPAGVCGTWPAFWTLGPNWPYTGEIDIMEGVNQNTQNIMSLHTNETCIIQGNSSVMTGTLENKNCAYYPDYNVGCGVLDPRPTSFGTGFNQAGGGVYAMQWTSEYIRIWKWSRDAIPSDVTNKQPDPSSWGLPAGQLAVGNCSVDQHFQDHKIIFDNTFCGEYAGNPYVWNTTDASSCAASTGLATCDNFVANYPAAFKDAYWSINYVRVYQLINPDSDAPVTTTYIASDQPSNAATNSYTAPTAVATLNLTVDSPCPQYNFSIISDGTYDYEIACDFDPPGPDIIGEPYYGFQAKSMEDCIKGCTYMNENNGSNTCGGVSHYAAINFCYFKKYIDATINYRPGYNEIRLIYYGYPQITDNPNSMADSTATSVFVETIPIPETYSPLTTASTTIMANVSITATTMTTMTSTIGIPPMGDNSTSAMSAVPPDYSETVTSGYLNTTRTEAPTASPVTSTNPSVTSSTFYIVFNMNTYNPRRLSKRDIQYLAFDSQGQSILVADQANAAIFQTGTDGMLMNGQQYVAIDSSVQPPRFSLTDDVPETPANVNVDDDGNVTVQGVNGYCVTSDGELAVSTDSGDLPDDCAPVTPNLIASSDNPTYTTSTMETTTTTLLMISVGETPPMSGPITETVIKTRSVSDSGYTTVVYSSSFSQSSSATSDDGSESDTTTGGSSSMTSSSTASAPDSSSTSDSSESDNTDSSTSTKASSTLSSSSTVSTATQIIINDFTYAGCFGAPLSASSSADIPTPFSDPEMTNDICTKHCGEQKAFYAGTSGVNCFCASSEALYASLIQYPDASCNELCPGASRDFCGGQAGFQDTGPATSTMALPRRGVKTEERQSVTFLISLYNNTVLLSGYGVTGVPTTSDSTTTPTTTRTTTGTTTNTISSLDTTTRPTGTDSPFPPGAVSYNITGTNTATVISTTYVDVCHVCPGGLTTMATTITVPHCGCIASWDTDMGQSVSVPSPIVPMITTAKACACGEGGVQSTITVTIPCSSSIALLSSQLPSVPVSMGVAAIESGNIGVMPSPAPADVGGTAGSVPSTMDEPETETETLDQGPDSSDHGSVMPNHESEGTDDTDVEGNMVSPNDENEEYPPYTNDIPLTTTATTGPGTQGTSPNDMAGLNGNNATAAAAPASSPSLSGAFNTAIPMGITNYTAPAATMGGPTNTNGSSTGSGPIASFTSGAASWVGDKFVVSLVVGMVVCCLVGGW